VIEEDRAREDIAFIRRAIEEGGAYATACSPDMLVWGVAIAVGYIGAYAFIRGWSPVPPNGVWAVCIGLAWLYSLRRQFARLFGGSPPPRGPMAQALGMLFEPQPQRQQQNQQDRLSFAQSCQAGRWRGRSVAMLGDI